MLTAGVGRSDLTPPLGAELQGYGLFLGRGAEGVSDRLQASAIVVESEQTRAGIVSCDLLGVSGHITETVRARAEAELNIPRENLMVAATHTHHGPGVVDLIGCGEVNGEYVSSLPGRILNALREAAAGLEPVTLWRGVTSLPDMQTNRVYGEGGPIDDRLWIAQLRRPDGSTLAVLANYNCHAVTHDPWPALISRDWPGVATDRIEQHLDGGRFLFLQGAEGDINPARRERNGDDAEATRIVGEQFAQAVIESLGQLEECQDEQIRGAVRSAALPREVEPEQQVRADLKRNLGAIHSEGLSREAYARALRDYKCACRRLEALSGESPDKLFAPLQVLRLGDVLLVGQPFELYTEFAVELRKRTALPHTWVVGCANDLCGYVGAPLPESLAGSPFYGYASEITPMLWGQFPFREDTGKLLVDEMVQLAESVT